jgi:hypothetical protein
VIAILVPSASEYRHNAPKDAHVGVQYGKRCHWIADTDIKSKSTFGVVMLLFNCGNGHEGAAPVVTIPAKSIASKCKSVMTLVDPGYRTQIRAQLLLA